MMFTLKKRKLHTVGECRKRRHFCLLPFKFKNTIFWLETITITEQLVECMKPLVGYGAYVEEKSTEWRTVRVERKKASLEEPL